MFWLPALLTLLVVVTLAVVALSIDRDRGREDTGAGTVPNTLANTPTELTGGIQAATATDLGSASLTGRRGVTPRVPALDGTVANTPTELRGGMAGQQETWTPENSAAERYSRHQMI
jgi:hypothetical protein